MNYIPEKFFSQYFVDKILYNVIIFINLKEKNMSIDFLKNKLLSLALVLAILSGIIWQKSSLRKISIGEPRTYLTLTYSEDSISGTIPAAEVSKYVKIITFKLNDITFTRLVGIYDHADKVACSPLYRTTEYYDLERGMTLISYINRDITGETLDRIEYRNGEDLEIISIEDFFPYLCEKGKFADEYEINSMLSFYREEVVPTFEENIKLVLD